MGLESFSLREKVIALIPDELYKHFAARGMEKPPNHRISISQALGRFKMRWNEKVRCPTDEIPQKH